MPHGCVARRAVLGSILLWSVVTLTSASGCQRLSVTRNDPSALPPLPPSARHVSGATPPFPAPRPGALVARAADGPPTRPEPAATPLLDAALVRAEALETRDEPVKTVEVKPATEPELEPV